MNGTVAAVLDRVAADKPRPIVFVGTRIGARHDRRVHELAAHANWVPSRALEVLAAGALGPAVRAELGAVNAWRSIDPLSLRIDADPTAVLRAMEGRNDLLDVEHPVALEVVHEQPGDVWWAIEVFRSTVHGAESRTDQVPAAVHRIVEAIGWAIARDRRA